MLISLDKEQNYINIALVRYYTRTIYNSCERGIYGSLRVKVGLQIYTWASKIFKGITRVYQHCYKS